MERPIPELAPVTIAFWPLSNLRFSVFGTTGFGKSIKRFCEYGTFGLGRLAASGGIVGMMFPLLFCGFVARSRDSLQARCSIAILSAFGRQHLSARKDFAARRDQSA